VLTLTSQQLFSSLKQAITIREAFSKLHVLSSPSPLSLFDLLHMINDVFKTKVIFLPSLGWSLLLFFAHMTFIYALRLLNVIFFYFHPLYLLFPFPFWIGVTFLQK